MAEELTAVLPTADEAEPDTPEGAAVMDEASGLLQATSARETEPMKNSVRMNVYLTHDPRILIPASWRRDAGDLCRVLLIVLSRVSGTAAAR
jgi:hypothetical protein